MCMYMCVRVAPFASAVPHSRTCCSERSEKKSRDGWMNELRGLPGQSSVRLVPAYLITIRI